MVCAIALAAAAGLVVGMAGCQVKTQQADLVAGKKDFVAKCGSCHTLARAGTKGVVGPNLDAAFAQSKADGIKRSTFGGVVNQQILYPNIRGKMPAKLVTGQQAANVAAYVARVASASGKDTGPLALTSQCGSTKPIAGKGGQLEIDACPTGQLLYLTKAATASAGAYTVKSVNKSSVPHDISLQGAGVNVHGATVSGGGVSQIKVNLKPGKYTFYCSVDGHRAAGMLGTLTVK